MPTEVTYTSFDDSLKETVPLAEDGVDCNSQHLAALGYPTVKTIPSKFVLHPSFAVENRMVMIKLAV